MAPEDRVTARRSPGGRALADRAVAEAAEAPVKSLFRQGAATGRQAGVSGGLNVKKICRPLFF